MELVNGSQLAAAYTVATDKTGRESLVLVAKGTFAIPGQPDARPHLLEEQVPLVMSDEFTGDAVTSAPLYESDFAPFKPRCDVILNGSCYAPGLEPTTSVVVGFRVGTLTKSFRVVGRRVWHDGLLSVSATSPEPFTVLPISYNTAFGGIDTPDGSPDAQVWFPFNHAGVGYHPKSDASRVAGRPLPNTEERDVPVVRPDGEYKPMAFGPVGRSWRPRVACAGTYDQDWVNDRAPFLPDDFDERYFQCAPVDQQTDYLRGGEEVVLVNLTRKERTAFILPEMPTRFEVYYKNEDWVRLFGVTDTLVLEPDQGRFTLTSRARLPLRRNPHEVRAVVLGRVPDEWYRDRGIRRGPRGKRRFRSLSDLADWNQKQRVRR